MPTETVRQLLNLLGYNSGDHDADVRAACREALAARNTTSTKSEDQ